MKSLIHPKDPYQMDWIYGAHPWGSVICPEGITYTCSTAAGQDTVTQRFVFTNVSRKHIFTALADIGIYTPFNDDYTSADICRAQRCHTHIWCGENVSYVMALRMGGEAPHLGLVLTKGSLGGYSVERDLTKQSNDRGDFVLHPSPAVIAPGESLELEWTLFWHEGKADFYHKAAQLNPNFIAVSCAQYVLFSGEEISMDIAPAFVFAPEDVSITLGGRPVDYRLDGSRILIRQTADCIGERKYDIAIGGIKTHCCVYVHERLDVLTQKRCRFIAQKQQYRKPGDPLDGAYLIYDNEEKHLFYSAWYDWDAGRERVGMGLLMAHQLKIHRDPALEQSLKDYAAFVDRELVDRQTGIVANDYGQTIDFLRLYDFPWFSLFYLELYTLFHEPGRLETAAKIMLTYYQKGGKNFYAGTIPLYNLMQHLKSAGMQELYGELLEHLKAHCQSIIEKGLSYPAHEVNYEQGIVYSATDLLLQMYELTGDAQYLTEGKRQLDVLELFNGTQPDYHLNQVAIRHWDGFWFGKRKLYGDTFPHYWSALTAVVLERYGKLTGDGAYLRNAELGYRAVLPLIRPDGTASCAYMYPVTTNGKLGKYYDPWANDQDWGLYFMLQHTDPQGTYL